MVRTDSLESYYSDRYRAAANSIVSGTGSGTRWNGVLLLKAACPFVHHWCTEELNRRRTGFFARHGTYVE